jgi:arylsulfatase
MSEQPHIIILMTDQQRADGLSCAGHPVLKTPHMDGLAAQGVRFSHAYTTCPVCMPARSSFLSGLYCHNHGQWYNYGKLPAETQTYAADLAAHGYHTCHIGKSHYYDHKNGEHLDQYQPYLRSLGWQEAFETTGPYATMHTDSILTDRWRKLGCLQTFREDYEKRKKMGGTATWPSPLPPGETADDFVGRTVVDYISNYQRKQPLLVFASFGGPHDPWDPPADWAARYNPAEMDAPLPTTAPPSWASPEAAAFQAKLQPGNSPYTPDVARRIRSLYYAKISHIDDWFGHIFTALKARGMFENSVIVHWSDHGEMLCDKGRIQKSVFYEPSARVPLIIRAPNKARGAVCSGLASIIDVYPTLLELAGCKTAPNGFGHSLLPALSEPSAQLRDAVFSEIDHPARTMIRDRRHKLVVDTQGTVLKLYDLAEDPREEVNLAGKPGTEDLVAALKHRMLAWYASTANRQREN